MLDENAAQEAKSESFEGPEVTPTRRVLSLRTFLRGTVPLGYAAFAIAVILVVAEAIAVSLASNGQSSVARMISQILVVLTGLPLAVGLFVTLRGPKREWGIAAMVVAVIANPLILINVLSFFGTL